MKKALTLFVLLLMSVLSFAQNPKLSYQAVVRDSQNKLVVEQPVTVSVTILKADNTSQFEQMLNATTNRNGLISLEIGDETDAWKNINWTDAKIRTAVVLSNGTEMVDTTNVNAVPFALYAEHVSDNFLSNYLDSAAVVRSIHDSLSVGTSAHHTHDNMATLNRTERAYHNADSTKLASIAEGAEVNVQADWNETSIESDAYIKNKPNIQTVPDNVSAFTNDAGYLTTDSTVITNLQSDLAAAVGKEKADSSTLAGRIDALENASMDCDDVNNCIKDTLGKYTPTDQLCAVISSCDLTTNSALLNLLTAMNARIDSLANSVDSLSRLPHGGGTPTVADGQPCPGTATVSDVDGNTYNTVKIGNQCWMKENLRTTTKRNNVGNVYTENTTAGYNAETYGYYYDWEAVMQNESGDKVQGICPTGWHVPTWAEYLQLTDYVNSQPIFCCYGESGKISKALASSEGWASVDRPDSECCIGNAPARNNWTRFSLMPAGHYLSEYRESGMEATIWSATDFGSMVHVLWLDAASDEIGETLCLREMGCSVRCLRDASIGGGDNPSEPATMSCEQVMQCMGDTLGRLNAKIEAQGAGIETLNGTVTTQGQTIETLNSTVESQGNTIDSLAHLVDSLSNLTSGGEPTATFTCGSSKVKDVDNNEYNTVKIGSQCWMAQNLRTSTNAAGAGHIYTPTASEVPGYDVNTYGRLYDWAAVMQGASSSDAVPSGVQGICPTGWHVPSDAEWTQLTTYVKSKSEYQCDGADNIANALSAAIGWSFNTSEGCYAGSISSTINLTGFSAVPAGLYTIRFLDFGHSDYFWSATEYDSNSAYYRKLSSNDAEVSRWDFSKDVGYSVRCLRDASIGGGDNPSEPATMSCEQVMECMGDTLGQLNAKIEAQGNTIDTLANLVDSLSRLIPDSPGIPTDTFICGTSTVTDHEGNVYNTVQVGDQCWTKENMRCTTSPSTGTTILEASPSSYSFTGKKAYYPNGNASNVATYGLLYNWCAAVDTFNTAYGETSTNTEYSNAPSVTFGGNRRGICPTGWHVPSNAEWDTLTSYVKSQSQYVSEGCTGTDNAYSTYCIAKALASTTGWSSNSNDYVPGNDPSTNNATGFSAVPAGVYFGSFDRFGDYAFFWSATQNNSYTAYYRLLDYSYANVGSNSSGKYYGFSVRCVRDGGVGGAPATNESGSAGNAGGSPDSGCCTELGARMDSLQNVIANLQNTVSSQDSVINALNNELHPFVCGTSTVTDHEGNVYNTVQIGDQCWTRENMRCTTSPSTGTSILEYPASSYSYTGKKAYYPNGNSSNVATYGLLYNWCAAVDTFNTAYGETSTNTEYSNAPSVTFGGNRRGICPTGWHVPSDAEWTALTEYVGAQSEYECNGMNTYIAKALASTTGWNSSTYNCDVGNTPGENNATGFSAVPAGDYSGSYNTFGSYASFWSATQLSSDDAYSRTLYYGTATVYRNDGHKYYGFSVRCVRDGGVGGAPATNESGSAGNAGGSPDSGCCTELGARMDSLQNTISDLQNTVDAQQNTISSQDSVINALNNQVNDLLPFECGRSTVKDHEGNVYNTVQIGDQCWTKENMRCTTSPSTGTTILEATPSSYSYTGKKAYYVDGSSSNTSTYGLLYNWNAAVDTFNTAYGETSTNTEYSNAPSVTFGGNRRGICPVGWHVPSDAEWTQLTTYVSSQSEYVCGSDNTNIGKALASTTGWNSYTGTSSNMDCYLGYVPANNNATGFSAVPAGNYYGSYYFFGYYAYFWSATQSSSSLAYGRDLGYYYADVFRYNNSKYYGYSVRCLRD